MTKLKMPAILGWLIAGMVLGPNAVELMPQAVMDASWYKIIIFLYCKFFCGKSGIRGSCPAVYDPGYDSFTCSYWYCDRHPCGCISEKKAGESKNAVGVTCRYYHYGTDRIVFQYKSIVQYHAELYVDGCSFFSSILQWLPGCPTPYKKIWG